MKTRPELLLASLCLLVACAPSDSSGDPGATPAAQQSGIDNTALMSFVLGDERAHQTLTELCTTAPNRLSGSRQTVLAAEWGEQVLQAMGCDRVWREEVTVPHWVRGDFEQVTVSSPATVADRELACTALGGSVGTGSLGVEGEVIEVLGLEQLRALDRAQVEGRIVFFNRPMDRSLPDTFSAYGGAVNQRSQGPSEASRMGALACLVRSMSTAIDDVPHTGTQSYASDVEPIPAAAISTQAAEELSDWLSSGQAVRLRLRLDCETLPPATAFNVLGEVTGSDAPDEVVLMGGHLDAWDLGSGAHDDGSGCVHAIEALRAILQMPAAPKRTVRVVLFANEENGLAGAEAYAASHNDHRHVFAIESDRGGFAPQGFSTNSTATTHPDLWNTVEGVLSSLQPYGVTRFENAYTGADVKPLEASGTITFGLITHGARYFDFHHTARDHPNAVHPRELSLGAGAMACLAWALANAPAQALNL